MAVASAAASGNPYTAKKKYRVVVDGEEFIVELETEVKGLR